MSTQKEDGIAKLFGKNALEKLREDPNLEPFFKDPDFISMCNSIAENPNDITKFENDPKMKTLLAALPALLSRFPKDDNEVQAPPPPLSNDAEEERVSGNTCFRSKDFNGALRHYNRAIEIDPKNIVYFTNKATTLLNLKRYEDAFEAILLGIEAGLANNATKPQLAKAYVKLSDAAQGCGKNEGALTALKESLDLVDDPVVRKMYDELQKKVHSQK